MSEWKPIESAPDEPNAFIVSDGERLAKWVNGEINWVDDPMDATRFSRACDAAALSTGYYMWFVRKLHPDKDKAASLPHPPIGE